MSENEDVDKMKEYLGIFPFDVPDAVSAVALKSYTELEPYEHEAVCDFIKSLRPTIVFQFMGRRVTLVPSRFGIGMGVIEFAYEPADDEPIFIEESFDLDEEEKILSVIVRIHNMIQRGIMHHAIERAYRKKHGY